MYMIFFFRWGSKWWYNFSLCGPVPNPTSASDQPGLKSVCDGKQSSTNKIVVNHLNTMKYFCFQKLIGITVSAAEVVPDENNNHNNNRRKRTLEFQMECLLGSRGTKTNVFVLTNTDT